MNCFSYLNKKNVKCSFLGLDLNREKNKKNLFKVFFEKYKNYGKKSYFSIFFKKKVDIFEQNNNNDNINGEILLGIPPHEYYKNKFFEKELIEINTQCSKDYLSWTIRFDSVYIEDIKNNSIKYFNFKKASYYDFDQYFGLFSPEINPLYIPNSVFNYYIDNYMNKYLNKECFKKGSLLYNKYLINDLFKDTQTLIYCDKTKILDISKFYGDFPSINFKNINFKEIFSFGGKELFLEDNNYLYFMIFPEFTKNNKLILGRIFMSKYQFTFNYDTKTIGYYNKNLSNFNYNYSIKDKNNNLNYSNNKNIFIIIILIFLFASVLCFAIFCIKKYLFKYNKYEKQALELSYIRKIDENHKKIFP